MLWVEQTHQISSEEMNSSEKEGAQNNICPHF